MAHCPNCGGERKTHIQTYHPRSGITARMAIFSVRVVWETVAHKIIPKEERL